MPVEHPTYGSREVLLDFWYTSDQLENVGAAWVKQDATRRRYVPPPQRQFVPGDSWETNMGEIAGCSGLNAEHLPELDALPFSFILPVNKGGNHWTSFAIKLTRNAAGKVNVHIGFCDSLPERNTDLPSWVKTEEDLIKFQLEQLKKPPKPTLPDQMQQEIERFLLMFSEKYGDIDFNCEPYQYTWFQPDGCACGAYAMANAQRFLDNKTDEPNPGPKALREAQLLDMRTSSAITQCSKSNVLDAILLQWMELHLSFDLTEKNPTAEKLASTLDWQISSEAVTYMIQDYAKATHQAFEPLNQLMRQEVAMSPLYPDAPIRPQPFLNRLIQLIILHPEKMRHPEVKVLAKEVQGSRENQRRAIATIQETVESAYDQSPSKQVTKETTVNTVFAQLYRMQTEEAVTLLTGLFGTTTPIPTPCLLAINTLVGVHQSGIDDQSIWPQHGKKCADRLLLTNSPQEILPPSLAAIFTDDYCKRGLNTLLHACKRYLKHHQNTSEQLDKVSVVERLHQTIINGLHTPKETFLLLRHHLQQPDDSTLDVLLKNRQSSSELILKIISILTVVFALGLAIKRLVDTGGKSINFFKPLSETVVATPLHHCLKP